MGTELQFEEGQYPKELQCAICLTPFDKPEEVIPCGHVFCGGCITSTVAQSCPECRGNMRSRRPANRIISTMASNLIGKCSTCDDFLGTREQFKAHECSNFQPLPPAPPAALSAAAGGDPALDDPTLFAAPPIGGADDSDDDDWGDDIITTAPAPSIPPLTLVGPTGPAISIGNDCTTITEGEWYEWTCFVRPVPGGTLPTNMLKVKFELHPTFNPRDVERRILPYECKRRGWGTFNVKVKVYRQGRRAPDVFDHYLCFDAASTSTVVYLQ